MPTGRTSIAKYKRVSRSQLPASVILRRTYRQRATPRGKRRRRRRQGGRRLFSFIKKVAENCCKITSKKRRTRYAYII